MDVDLLGRRLFPEFTVFRVLILLVDIVVEVRGIAKDQMKDDSPKWKWKFSADM